MPVGLTDVSGELSCPVSKLGMIEFSNSHYRRTDEMRESNKISHLYTFLNPTTQGRHDAGEQSDDGQKKRRPMA